MNIKLELRPYKLKSLLKCNEINFKCQHLKWSLKLYNILVLSPFNMNFFFLQFATHIGQNLFVQVKNRNIWQTAKLQFSFRYLISNGFIFNNFIFKSVTDRGPYTNHSITVYSHKKF